MPERYHVVKDQALTILTREDSFRAIEFIMASGTPLDVMNTFRLITRELYWENRNLPAAMAFGRAGIQYGLSHVDAANGRKRSKRDREAAYELASMAKALAYDLSSFSWPGWNEPGIVIDDSQLVLAQDLAKTNLRLAKSLDKGNVPLSRAFWLIGAHHLAVDQHEAARRAFVEGLKYATAAGAKELELLLKGYVYLADMLKDPDNEELSREFTFILGSLETSREGTFYSEQLQTARWVFLGVPTDVDPEK